jgi:hypothetical protein
LLVPSDDLTGAEAVAPSSTFVSNTGEEAVADEATTLSASVATTTDRGREPGGRLAFTADGTGQFSRMASYRRSRDRLHRLFAAALFVAGLVLLVEAIWLDRGGATYATVVPILIGAVVTWLTPPGRPTHPPNESTLQWARKQRRAQR